jgi:RNA polymerase sigma-70 factor (ECF subfamily)
MAEGQMELASKLDDGASAHNGRRRLTPEELCERYAARVYQFAAMVSRNETEAEDLAQDALLRALTRLERYDPERGDLEAWLWRIVANVARDAGRVAKRRQALVQRLLLSLPRSQPIEPDLSSHLADENLLGAVRELDPRSRAIIALRFGADLDYAGVGAALGISPEAAGMATRRALAALRRRLEAQQP